MAEIAEVEVLSQELHDLVSFCTIEHVWQSPWYLDRRVSKRPESDLSCLLGWSISSVRRFGKGLLFSMENPGIGSKYLASRLGMTGQWLVKPADVDPQSIKHCRLTLTLFHPQGRIVLAYVDTRGFGVLEVRDFIHELACLSLYGPDILSAQFTRDWVLFSCQGKRVPIKHLLLDQSHFAGIGNWLASEILFFAHIHPMKLAKDLVREEIDRLFAALHMVISTAIQRGGATFKDYAHADGGAGSAQDGFMVYGRGGKPCLVCAEKVQRIVINRRSTFLCATCQAMDWQPPMGVSEDFVRQMARGMDID